MLITDASKCVGCAKCETICPVNAISMQENNNKIGFKYPVIDQKKCILCKKCINECISNKVPEKDKPIKYLIAQSNSKEILQKSTSGGLATELSKKIISCGGVVYGAKFNKKMQLKHVECNRLEDIYTLSGSKYIQTDMSGIHKLIESNISKGKLVLFIGTPCQCASLDYLKKYKNFFLIDFVCNGVASPKVFKCHVTHIEEKYKKSISNYVFRPKTHNYLEPYELVEFDDGNKKLLISPWEKWGTMYYKGILMRESCFECRYTDLKRLSDITLSDIPESIIENKGFKNDVSKYGASYLSVNSEKGVYLLSLLDDCCYLKTVDVFTKERMMYSTKKPEERIVFEKLFDKMELEKVKIAMFGYRLKFKSYIIKLAKQFVVKKGGK